MVSRFTRGPAKRRCKSLLWDSKKRCKGWATYNGYCCVHVNRIKQLHNVKTKRDRCGALTKKGTICQKFPELHGKRCAHHVHSKKYVVTSRHKIENYILANSGTYEHPIVII